MSGTPYLAGSNGAASGGGTDLVVDVSTDVAAFDTILVAVGVSFSGVTVTVSDSAGNNYDQILSDTTETDAQLYVFESDGSNALSVDNGDFVTVSYSANTSRQVALVIGDNNVQGSDKTVIAHGSSASPSSGSSGTLSQSAEHVIGIICNANAGGTPSSWTGTTTVLGTQTGGSSTPTRLTAAYTDVTASTAKTAGATITSADWACAIVTTEVNPILVTGTLSGGVEGDPYSQTLEASGGSGSYTWTISSGSLPSGLSLSSGVISGTPTVSGDFTFTIEATDANSATGTLDQTITILATGAGGAPATVLPNNLVPLAESDMESSNTWHGYTNASGEQRTNKISLTGDSSLRWTATAAGDTAVETDAYDCLANKPYIASCYIMPPSPSVCQVGLAWYDNTATFIQLDLGPESSTDTIEWQPVTVASVAPSNATTVKVVPYVQAANAGDIQHVDLVYLTQTDTQVLIDWVNNPFSAGSSAGNDFMDVSPFVRKDQSIQISRGRQDAISEILTGSASFTLQNDVGQFTKFKSTTIPAILGGNITLQRRCQINLTDENGKWYTRFDGPISELDYSFDNTGNTSSILVSVADVLAYLNRQDSLSCWTKEQVLFDSPWLHWSLNDAGNAGGAGVAAETSGNNGPPMRLWNSDNTKTGTIAFQDTSGGVETLADAVAAGEDDGSEYWTADSNQPNNPVRGLDSGAVGPYSTPIGSVALTPRLVSESGPNYFVGNQGYQLQATLPENITPWDTGDDYTFECWFTVDPTVVTDKASDYGPYIVMSLGTARLGTCLVAGIYLTGGTPFTFTVGTYDQPPAFLGKNFPGTAPPSLVSSITQSLAADSVPIPHHLVLTITGDDTAPTLTAWLDGVEFSSPLSLPKRQYYDTFVVGGAFGGTGCHYGNISLASIYQYELSSDQITQHTMLGQYGMWEQTTDDCINLLATFANLPSFWNNVQGSHNGLTMTEYQDITGANALSNMQLYEQAESGLLFVDATGELNFHTRDWRMGYGSPDLTLPPDTFDADMGYELIDQYMQNEAAVATQTYQTGASYVNADSQSTYGVYATSPADSPIQLPLITFNRAYAQLGVSSFNYFSDPNLDDYAAWNANAFSEPWLTPGQLTFDILTMNPATGIAISDLYKLEIDMMVSPGGDLPDSFPDDNLSMEWFIEGINETIGQGARTFQIYTSPAETQRAWVPGDEVYGVLGTTTRIGISQADTSVVQADGKDVSHDSGRPYWPPNFDTTMNNPAQNGHSFIGAVDIRGLTDNLSLLLNPPMCVVGAVDETQSQSSGSQSQPQIFWDTVFVDTVSGMGAIPGWPNWYCCLVPGFYEIDASIVWAAQSSGDANTTSQSWVIVAQQGAQSVATGGSPLSAVEYVCPIGESSNRNSSSINVVESPSTRIYLGLGDMVTIGAEQNVGSARATGLYAQGSVMSLRWVGYGTVDDRVQLNSTINGGTSTQKQVTTTHTKTYKNTHTYCYYGPGSQNGTNRRNQDGDVYQGTYAGGSSVNGSMCAQIVWPHATIASDLSAANTKIKSVTLKCTNLHTWYNSGGKLMLGYSTQTPGGKSFSAKSVSARDIFEESFGEGQTKTFTLPNSFATTFQNNGKFFVVGNSSTTNLDYYGFWRGGANNWTLTITYTVTS